MNCIMNIIVDGKTINIKSNCNFKGIGIEISENTPQLLMNYKKSYPEIYHDIMAALFQKNYGAGFSHIKIKLNSYINSLSEHSSEKNSAAGYSSLVFAADAKAINPEISIILNTDNNDINNSYRYIVKKIYELYGIKFDYISADDDFTIEYKTLDQVLTAEEPWSGYYSIGSEFWQTAHLTHFIDNQWKCLSKDYPNYSVYMSNEDDYTLVFNNKDIHSKKYKIILKNLKHPEKNLNYIESKSLDSDMTFEDNWFKLINRINPSEDNGEYSFNIEVKPFSILTVTTCSVDNVNGNKTIKVPDKKSKHLYLPYFDNFNYSNESEIIPLYSSTLGGIFNIISDVGVNVLEQGLTSEFYGETPVITIGDNKWCDYTMRAEVKFDNNCADNYTAIGIRHNNSETECGYQIRIFPDGKWQFKYMNNVIESGFENSISSDCWNHLKISAEGRHIKAYVNKELVCDYFASSPMITAGKVSLYSAFYKNKFKNMAVIPVLGSPVYYKRIDCLSGNISYSDGWLKNTIENNSLFYNGTSVSANKNNEFFSFNFCGENFSLIGVAENLKLKIEVDDKILAAGFFIEYCDAKQSFYSKRGLGHGSHYVKITILSGSLSFDSVEISENSHDIIKFHKKNQENEHISEKIGSGKKLKKSTLIFGAGIAAAGAGFLIAMKKIKNFSLKKLDK